MDGFLFVDGSSEFSELFPSLFLLGDKAPEHMLDSPETNPNHDETDSNVAIDHHDDEENESNLCPEGSFLEKAPNSRKKRGNEMDKGPHRESPWVLVRKQVCYRNI